MKKYTVLLFFAFVCCLSLLNAQTTFQYSLVQDGDDVCVQVTPSASTTSSCYAGGNVVLIFPAGTTASIGGVTSSGALGAWSTGTTIMNFMGIDFIQYNSTGLASSTANFVIGEPQTLFCIDAGTCDSANKIRLMEQANANSSGASGADLAIYNAGVTHSITHGMDCASTTGAAYNGLVMGGCTSLDPACPPAAAAINCSPNNSSATIELTITGGCPAYSVTGDFSGSAPSNGANVITTSINAPGTYMYTVTDANGCEVAVDQMVTISADCAPVELSNFTATAQDVVIALDWAIASELNFDGYELQRGLDGVNFEKLAWVQGSENSLEAKEYRYLDANVKGGIVYYYRLKMIDLDGSYEYSAVRSAQIGGKAGDVTAFPNPTNTILNLTINVSEDDRINIRFYDATGKVALERVQDINEGNNLLEYNVSDLPSGLYRIVVDGQQIRATQNVVVMD